MFINIVFWFSCDRPSGLLLFVPTLLPSILLLFLCLYFILAVPMHAWVFWKTLLHEFPVSYSHTEWYFLSFLFGAREYKHAQRTLLLALLLKWPLKTIELKIIIIITTMNGRESALQGASMGGHQPYKGYQWEGISPTIGASMGEQHLYTGHQWVDSSPTRDINGRASALHGALMGGHQPYTGHQWEDSSPTWGIDGRASVLHRTRRINGRATALHRTGGTNGRELARHGASMEGHQPYTGHGCINGRASALHRTRGH